MRIGYPCLNLTLGCTSSRTFRLINWSEERFLETVALNLDCLAKILEFNRQNDLLFFRICSGLIPFASHPINKIRWQKIFQKQFAQIGAFLKDTGMRVSTHPDQFILINTLNTKILHSSLRELIYHAEMLELLGTDSSHKIQIHIGGAYGDKTLSAERFITEFKSLPEIVKNRLVVENDDRIYSTADCLAVSKQIKIPIVFDYYHYQLNNQGEDLRQSIEECFNTWGLQDGPMIIDYSSPKKNGRRGSHAESIEPKDFEKFYKETRSFNYDLMLEIKDKESSALRAREIVKSLEK